MTPEHRLAIEIMSECGMSPHEIVASFGAEGVCMDLVSVEKITNKKPLVKLSKYPKRLYEFMKPGQLYRTRDFAQLVKAEAARRICGYLYSLELIESLWLFDPKSKRSEIAYRRTA